ncbi:site-specific integrase [Rhodobacteraceae bacterium WD3A24]|nr:site-specific integrase [Rhodobacteraceae bacterium WD3A24]
MADIRKRVGKKGTTYQVRYPSKSTKSGYAFRTFNTLKEAREFTQNLGALREPDDATRTVAEAVELWLQVCEKEGRGDRDPVTDATMKGYELRARIINEFPWDAPLHELEQRHIVEFRSWLKRNYSLYMARRVLSALHSVIIEMNQRGMMTHDPAAGITVKKQSRYDNPVAIPTQGEVGELLAAADRLAASENQQTCRTWSRYRPMIYLAASSGMRPQEYCALRVQDVTDEGIRVVQAVDKLGNIGPPKTRAARRFIPISDIAIDMVQDFVRHSDRPAGSDLVFPTRNGTAQLVDNFRSRAWYPLMEEAGLVIEDTESGEGIVKSKYSPYALRHFFASMLIQKRTNLKRLQKIMGHADIQITFDTYGHLIDDIEAREAHESRTLLADVLGGCGESVAELV